MAFVHYETQNRVGYITLSRANERNALNPAFINQLKDAFSQAEADEDCKVIVLRAEGPVFCAGADLQYIKSLAEYTYNQNLEDGVNLKNLFQQIYTLRKLVIAQVHGHAIAAGCALAMVCDLSYAAPEAQFGFTEVKTGFLPALAIKFLVRKIGEGRARQLLLTGDLITAKKATEFGLVNEVVPAAKLTNFVQDLAERLCRENSGHSIGLAKQLFGKSQDKKLSKALKYAAEMNATARNSVDCKKGIQHFLNKESFEW